MTLLLMLLAPASAKCRGPQAIVSSDGQVVPADPVVWVFVPSRQAEDFRVEARDTSGEPVAAVATRAPGGPELQVWRVALDRTRNGEISLQARWSEGGYPGSVDATLTVLPDWPWRARRTPTAQDAGATRLQWTCSHQESRDLRVDAPDAVAYELVWAISESDWARGEVQTITLPQHWQQVFGSMESSSTESSSTESSSTESPAPIALGYLNCTGEWFEWRQPQVWVGVRALYADGSRSPLPAGLQVAAP
jgi:hypothetical protein